MTIRGEQKEPGERHRYQAECETGNQVIFRHGYIEGEVEGRINQRNSTSREVVKDSSDMHFVSYGTRLADVFMYQAPAEPTQDPPTEGLVSASPSATAEI